MIKYTEKEFEQIKIAGKDNLPIGTILQLHGYNYDKYVIVKNEGENKYFRGHGSRYRAINLENHRYKTIEAMTLEWITDKTNDRIQTYITNRQMDTNEIANMIVLAKINEQNANAEQNIANEMRIQRLNKGKVLFSKFIPKEAKALIIAEKTRNKTDYHTDYFGHICTETVILGWSKHKRQLFPEMRKHADVITETAHLKEKPIVNRYGRAKDEHRENYSGGGGTYLKDGDRHDTGWQIRKVVKYGDEWNSNLLESIADRCELTEK